jgi:hypothetical protein
MRGSQRRNRGKIKKWLKLLLLAVLIVFIVIQFFPAEKNISAGQNTDISHTYPVPPAVQALLNEACYDCHSNNTNYPWYTRVQPFGWWLANHIKNGKKELNFHEFSSYSLRRQVSKLKAISGSLKDGSMPLKSYTLIHRDARLSATEKKDIIAWVEKLKDSLLTRL